MRLFSDDSGALNLCDSAHAICDGPIATDQLNGRASFVCNLDCVAEEKIGLRRVRFFRHVATLDLDRNAV